MSLFRRKKPNESTDDAKKTGKSDDKAVKSTKKKANAEEPTSDKKISEKKLEKKVLLLIETRQVTLKNQRRGNLKSKYLLRMKK